MRVVSFLADVVRHRAGLRTQPRFLTYIVTFTCNARCVMCDSWKKPSPDDLTLEEIEGIFGQLPRLDAVRLSGGEPFARTDLGEIAALAQRLLDPSFLHVTTNGFLTDRIVTFCEKRAKDRPLRLLVSLDGLKERHNAIRGRATAFEMAVATLRALAPRREELRLHLSVNQTLVDKEGLEEYRRLREFLRPLAIQLQAVLAYDASATYSLGGELDHSPKEGGRFPAFGAIDAGAAGRFLDEAERDARSLSCRTGRRVSTTFAAFDIVCNPAAPAESPCVALNSHLRLLPNGDVPTCQFNARIVGNLRRQSFREVWDGVLAGQQRDWVKRCPGCWAECEVLPNAVYSADLIRTLFSRGTSVL